MIEERLAVDLDRMLVSALDATSFVSEMSEAEFGRDRKTQAAASMCLIIVAEAAARITRRFPAFVADHDDWPWDRMRDLRNRIVHDYDNIDLRVV